MVIDLDTRRGAVEVLIHGRERGLTVRVSVIGNVRVHQAKLSIDKSRKENHLFSEYLHVVDAIRSSLLIIERSEESEKNNPTNTITIKKFIISFSLSLKHDIRNLCRRIFFLSKVDVASDW